MLNKGRVVVVVHEEREVCVQVKRTRTRRNSECEGDLIELVGRWMAEASACLRVVTGLEQEEMQVSKRKYGLGRVVFVVAGRGEDRAWCEWTRVGRVVSKLGVLGGCLAWLCREGLDEFGREWALVG